MISVGSNAGLQPQALRILIPFPALGEWVMFAGVKLVAGGESSPVLQVSLRLKKPWRKEELEYVFPELTKVLNKVREISCEDYWLEVQAVKEVTLEKNGIIVIQWVLEPTEIILSNDKQTLEFFDGKTCVML